MSPLKLSQLGLVPGEKLLTQTHTVLQHQQYVLVNVLWFTCSQGQHIGFFFLPVMWYCYSGPNHAAPLQIPLKPCNCAARKHISGAMTSPWAHPLWQSMRWDQDKYFASTSLFLFFFLWFQCRARGFSGPACHPRREPKGCSLFMTHMAPLFHRSRLAFPQSVYPWKPHHEWFIEGSLHYSFPHQSANTQLFSLPASEATSASVNGSFWRPFFNTLKSKPLCIYSHVQIHVFIIFFS